MKDVDFEVNTGDVFIIMGGSGSGKSSLLRVLTGLKEPAKGKVWLNGKDFYAAGEKEQKILMQNCGIL